MKYRLIAAHLSVLLVCTCSANAQTQEAPEPDSPSLDTRLLLSVYNIESPAFATAMYAADVAAYPAFYGAVPGAWMGAIFLRDEEDYRDAYLLTLSFMGSYLSSTYLKKLFRRPRPSAELADLRVRDVAQHEREQLRYEYSFPSGHAAMAFTIVASYSFSHPKWYVLAPGFTWATATALTSLPPLPSIVLAPAPPTITSFPLVP